MDEHRTNDLSKNDEKSLFGTKNNTDIFSRVHATLHLAVSVRPSVGSSVRHISKILTS